jgi:hypothetical protein
MRNLHRVRFIWDFLRKNKADACFKTIYYNNKSLIENPSENIKLPKVISINLYPTYLKHELVNAHDYHLKRINQVNFKGAGITISEKTEFKKTIARLEKCFNISYEYNYGDITKEKCDFLLNVLHQMLSRRFNQKQVQNHYFLIWEDFTKDISSLINQKKASLFVAYDGDKPINISLNFHISHTIMFSEINAFDIDYSKFGLGHLGNTLLINWCITNNCVFLDLGNGVINYKKHICDTFYNFEYLIYYKKNSIIAWGIMLKELFFIHLKNTLKSLNIISIFQNIKNKVSGNNNVSISQDTIWKSMELNKKESLAANNLTLINLNDDTNAFLRKPVYDYLYSKKLHIDTIKIYEVVNKKNTFLIKAENEIIKISIT